LDSETHIALLSALALCGGLIAAIALLLALPRVSTSRLPTKFVPIAERVSDAVAAMLARPGSTLQALGITRHQQEVVTTPSQTLGVGGADAGRGASDQGGSEGGLSIHGKSPGWGEE
jgi:hypothetical protein